MTNLASLLETLADGRFHSGEALGARLGVSRAAVWKALKGLERFGLEPQGVPGRGYRLARPLELLDPNRVREAMSLKGRRLLSGLTVHLEVDSTNTWLLKRSRLQEARGGACLSEFQTAGRGRRGRPWVSPFASNIYLSVSWHFDGGSETLGALSLAVGVALLRALAPDVPGLGLKWPNDLVVGGRKLAGVLVEVSGEAGGPCRVVVGIGVNFAMPREAGAAIGQPWTDLRQHAPALSRNAVAGRLLDQTLRCLEAFETEGFEPFRVQWEAADWLAGQRVSLELPGDRAEGWAAGIDTDGALLVETSAGRRRFHFGEVSIRPAEAAGG